MGFALEWIGGWCAISYYVGGKGILGLNSALGFNLGAVDQRDI